MTKFDCHALLSTQSDSRQVFGMLATLEKFQSEAEERGNAFLLGALEKQHMRLKALFERRVVRQSLRFT